MQPVRRDSFIIRGQWLRAGAFLLAGLAAGCASARDNVAMAFVDPGTLVYYSCPQLADSARAFLKRKKDLEELMTKASGDAAGGMISIAVYQSDYLNAVGSLKVIAETQKEKNCVASASQQSGTAIR
jgi:hypothetical protein